MDHTPARTAAADQAMAAFDHARNHARTTLERYSGHEVRASEGAPDGTPEARILDHFLDWLERDGTSCPHRPLRQPHAYWAGISPVLCCGPCFRELNELLKTMALPTVCDMCLKPRCTHGPWLPRAMVIGGHVADDGAPLAAITIVYILCPECAA